MTSSTALACRRCADCGLGPSQSFRADFNLASSNLSSPFVPTRKQNSRWAVKVCSRKGGVSMEYGGNVNRPSLVGERELITGVQMLQKLRKQLLEAINMEVRVKFLVSWSLEYLSSCEGFVWSMSDKMF